MYMLHIAWHTHHLFNPPPEIIQQCLFTEQCPDNQAPRVSQGNVPKTVVLKETQSLPYLREKNDRITEPTQRSKICSQYLRPLLGCLGGFMCDANTHKEHGAGFALQAIQVTVLEGQALVPGGFLAAEGTPPHHTPPQPTPTPTRQPTRQPTPAVPLPISLTPTPPPSASVSLQISQPTKNFANTMSSSPTVIRGSMGSWVISKPRGWSSCSSILGYQVGRLRFSRRIEPTPTWANLVTPCPSVSVS